MTSIVPPTAFKFFITSLETPYFFSLFFNSIKKLCYNRSLLIFCASLFGDSFIRF